MDPRYIEAKLDADKAAREMVLWRELDRVSVVAESWPLAIVLVCSIAFLVLGDLPRSVQQMFLLLMVLVGVQFATMQKRITAISTLLKIHLKDKG